jgi:hypothetical protein
MGYVGGVIFEPEQTFIFFYLQSILTIELIIASVLAWLPIVIEAIMTQVKGMESYVSAI